MNRPAHVTCANCAFFEPPLCIIRAPVAEKGWPRTWPDKGCGEFRPDWPEPDEARRVGLDRGELCEECKSCVS